MRKLLKNFLKLWPAPWPVMVLDSGNPILIDLGQLKTDPKVKMRSFCAEMQKKTGLFKHWLKKHYLGLIPFFEQQLDKLGYTHASLSRQ